MLKAWQFASPTPSSRRDGLVKLDSAFSPTSRGGTILAPERCGPVGGRRKPPRASTTRRSALILEIAPHLTTSLADLFGIQSEFRALAARHHELAPLHTVKRQFVQRRAANKVKPEEAAKLERAGAGSRARARAGRTIDELAFARKVSEWLSDEAAHAAELDAA